VITQGLPRSVPRQPDLTTPIYGALAGALLMTALVAVWYLGWKTFGLPFPPFDVFDWFVRALPGDFVTRVIEVNVAVGRALGASSIGSAAKIADQIMAVGGVIVVGTLAGAALFALARLSGEPTGFLGLVIGGVAGGLVVVAEMSLARVPAAATRGNAPGAWVVVTLVAWGMLLGRVFEHLRDSQPANDDDVLESPRRRFLQRFVRIAVLTTAATTVLGVVAGRLRKSAAGARWSENHALPNAASLVVPVRGTRAEFTPLEDHYRIDTNTRPPELSGDRWRLIAGGLVARPLVLSLAQIRELPAIHQFITLSCISNPVGGDLIGTTRWTGISLQELLAMCGGVGPSATYLRVTSADGFYEVVSLDVVRSDERVMLAYEWDGVPLTTEHGYPLRLYVPDLYGMKQPKWIAAIEAIDHWEPGFWVSRGWDREGRVKTTSAIDAVIRRDDVVDAGGFAYAGARGISRVELRLDDGEWQAAQIREPMSGTAWVVWRYALRAPAGKHRITVRAVDGSGQAQSGALHFRDL
jgi:DMSO/TMAO reductase YedYZ molybdopterin-dependent catalytic subunit